MNELNPGEMVSHGNRFAIVLNCYGSHYRIGYTDNGSVAVVLAGSVTGLNGHTATIDNRDDSVRFCKDGFLVSVYYTGLTLNIDREYTTLTVADVVELFLIDRNTTRELDKLTNAVTAFGRFRDLEEACNGGYVPTLYGRTRRELALIRVLRHNGFAVWGKLEGNRRVNW